MLRALQACAVYIRGSIASFTTEISVDDTHEEGNGNGNANARRPGFRKCPAKGTHPSASKDIRKLRALEHYLIPQRCTLTMAAMAKLVSRY